LGPAKGGEYKPPELAGRAASYAQLVAALTAKDAELRKAALLAPANGVGVAAKDGGVALKYDELVGMYNALEASTKTQLAEKTRELDEAIQAASLRQLSLHAHSEQIDDANKKHAEAVAANAQLKDRNHELGQINARSNEIIAALRKQLDGGDVPTLRAELASLRGQLTKSEEALAKSKEQYEQTKDKLAEARAAVASARSSDEDRLQDLLLKKAQEALAASNTLIASLRAQLAAQAPGGNNGALHQTVAGMNAEIASLQQQLREAQTQLAASQKQAATLTRELEEANAEIDELENKDDNIDPDTLDVLRDMVTQSKEEIVDLKRKLAEAEEDRRNSVRGMSAEIETLARELDATRQYATVLEEEKITHLRANGSSGHGPRPSSSSRSSWASLKAKVPVRTYLPGVLPA
jgi:chromosome segregation ATPase